MGATLLAGCSFLSTDPGGQKAVKPTGAKGDEAPMLAERVRSGGLPAVKDRLPKTPLVVQPIDRIGKYGGTWETALLGAADTAWLGRTVAYDRIVHWDLGWKEIVPNVAESYEVSADAKVYTFKLREGMKWSDGKPFTSDDVMFWYEAIFSNATLTPAKPLYLQTREQPVVVDAPDATTVRFTFKHPNGLFLQWLATYDTGFDFVPKHYMSQFHKDHNPNIADLVAKEKAPDWSELFLRKLDPWNNVERPRLHAWLPKNTISDGNRMAFERNPYYFKVDPDGSQLPYLDNLVYNIFSEEEAILLQASNGRFDYHSRQINISRNKPVLADNREKGNFSLINMPTASMNTMVICPNLTHADPVRRRMLQNKNFRIALSHGIDRQQIIDIVFKGQGEPWQTAPRPEAPFYPAKDMAKQYTEHDPAKANQILDDEGFAERDGSGIRLDSAGKPIALTVMAQNRYFEMVDALELIVDQWAKIGIRLRVANMDGTLFDSRVEANDFDLAVDTGEYGYVDAIVDPRYFFPSYLSGASYAPLWYRWYADDKPSEPPPPAMQRQMSLYRNELQAEKDPEGQGRVMAQIVEIARDEFWTMGISLPPDSYGIVRNDFHNVPKTMWEASRYPTPGPSMPCQYFSERTS
ncbi:ABC transporter substrate-binding protein [Actinopolymorpha pittospori]|uniref:Peptide/nickel transport system substrate-binding protein n=1 Tax=Actinopolymorpha pittospori TaxID=648752 RepID=A0A927MYI9_9ACTN|nr:ABC transporter substrate-binding protein [Actinopolymorpha pittospori]MBE1609306.1 peptide/nickel transport system substrate-binding protein [Actinopolymorpha pittospori]